MRRKYLYLVILSLLLTSAITFSVRFFKNNGFDNKIENTDTDEFKNDTLPIPQDKTPNDLDAISNLFVSLGVFFNKNYFQFIGEGEVVSEPRLVSTQRQPIYERASFYNGAFVIEGISPSKMDVAKVVEHHYENPDKSIFLVYKGNCDAEGKNITWPQEPKKYSKEAFHTMYGIRQKSPTPYIINRNYTLIENSVNQVKLDNDILKITFSLNPQISTELYKRTIKTQGRAKNNPNYSKVSLSFYIDKNWNILKTDTYTEYDVDIYGGASCVSKITHTFTYLNKQVQDIQMYEKFFDNKTDDKIEEDKVTPIELLTQAFEKYLTKGFNFLLKKDDANLLKLSIILPSINNKLSVKGELSSKDISFLLEDNTVLINNHGVGEKVEISEIVKLLKTFGINPNIDEGELVNKLLKNTLLEEKNNIYSICIQLFGFSISIKMQKDSCKILSIKLLNKYPNLECLNNIDVVLTEDEYTFNKLDNYNKSFEGIFNFINNLLDNKLSNDNSLIFNFSFTKNNLSLKGDLKLEIKDNNLNIYLNSLINENNLKLSIKNNNLYLEYKNKAIKIKDKDFIKLLNLIKDIIPNSSVKSIIDCFISKDYSKLLKNIDYKNNIEEILKNILLNESIISYLLDDNKTLGFDIKNGLSLLINYDDINFLIKKQKTFNEFTELDCDYLKADIVESIIHLKEVLINFIKTKEIKINNFNFTYKDFSFNGVIKYKHNNTFRLKGIIKHKDIKTSVSLVFEDDILYITLFNNLKVSLKISDISSLAQIFEYDVKPFDLLNNLLNNTNLINTLKHSIKNANISYDNIVYENIEKQDYKNISEYKSLLKELSQYYKNFIKDEKIEDTLNITFNILKDNQKHNISLDIYFIITKDTIDLSAFGSYKINNKIIDFRVRYDGYKLFIEYQNKKLCISHDVIFNFIENNFKEDIPANFSSLYEAFKSKNIFNYLKNSVNTFSINKDLDTLFNSVILDKNQIDILLKDDKNIKLLFKDKIEKIEYNQNNLELIITKTNKTKDEIILSIDNACEIEEKLVNKLSVIFNKFKPIKDTKMLKVENFKYKYNDNFTVEGRLLFNFKEKKISLEASFQFEKIKFNATLKFLDNKIYIKALNNARAYLKLDEIDDLKEILKLININFLESFNLKKILENFSLNYNFENLDNILENVFVILSDKGSTYDIINDILEVINTSYIAYTFNDKIEKDDVEYNALSSQFNVFKNLLNTYIKKDLDIILKDKYQIDGSIYNEKTKKQELIITAKFSKKKQDKNRDVMLDLLINDLVREQEHHVVVYYENDLFYLIYNSLVMKIKPAPLKELIAKILEIIGIENDLLFKLLKVDKSEYESVLKDKIFSNSQDVINLDEVCYDGLIEKNKIAINLFKKLFKEFMPENDLISYMIFEEDMIKEFVLENLYVDKHKKLDLKLQQSNHTEEASLEEEKKTNAVNLENLEKIAAAFYKTQALKKYHLVATGQNSSINARVIGIPIYLEKIDVKIVIDEKNKLNMHATYYHHSALAGTATRDYYNTHNLYIKDDIMFMKRQYSKTLISPWSYQTYTNQMLRSLPKHELIATLFSLGYSVKKELEGQFDNIQNINNKKIPPLDAILSGYKSVDEENYDITFNLKALTGDSRMKNLDTKLKLKDGYLHKINFDTWVSVLHVFGEFELISDNDSWTIDYPSDFS